jgi:hypothetical protein
LSKLCNLGALSLPNSFCKCICHTMVSNMHINISHECSNTPQGNNSPQSNKIQNLRRIYFKKSKRSGVDSYMFQDCWAATRLCIVDSQSIQMATFRFT